MRFAYNKKAKQITSVPNLFSTTDWFRGRQFFHGEGAGWGDRRQSSGPNGSPASLSGLVDHSSPSVQSGCYNHQRTAPVCSLVVRDLASNDIAEEKNKVGKVSVPVKMDRNVFKEMVTIE